MGKFKVGDIVQRITPVCAGAKEKTGMVQFGVYTVAYVSPAGHIGFNGMQNPLGQMGYFTFAEDSFALVRRADKVEPPKNWDLEYAKQLRYEAEVAVCRYNQYLQQQPQMQPIVIK